MGLPSKLYLRFVDGWGWPLQNSIVCLDWMVSSTDWIVFSPDLWHIFYFSFEPCCLGLLHGYGWDVA